MHFTRLCSACMDGRQPEGRCGLQCVGAVRITAHSKNTSPLPNHGKKVPARCSPCKSCTHGKQERRVKVTALQLSR